MIEVSSFSCWSNMSSSLLIAQNAGHPFQFMGLQSSEFSPLQLVPLFFHPYLFSHDESRVDSWSTPYFVSSKQPQATVPIHIRYTASLRIAWIIGLEHLIYIHTHYTPYNHSTSFSPGKLSPNSKASGARLLPLSPLLSRFDAWLNRPAFPVPC